jgi:hypothetical protein
MSSNLKSNNKVDLNLVILDNKCTEEEYNEFIVQYKKNSKDLCLKKNGTKTQNILTYLFERKLENINIYYISERKNIIAFCLIHDRIKDKIVEVKLLCSSTKKKFINKISLGKYLLNIIYDHFVKIQYYLMIIQPASPELIAYYVGWKTPSFNNLNETFGHLIYGNLESASNETLTIIFNSLISIIILKKYLKTNINTNKMSNLENLKNVFRNNLKKKTDITNSERNQLSNKINSLIYVNPKQIKNHKKMI